MAKGPGSVALRARTMVILCVNLFRSSRFCSLSAHLTRNFRVCKQAGHPVKKAQYVSSQITCHRTTNSAHFRATPAAPSLSFCRNGRTACFQVGPTPTSPLQPGPVVLTQCGHLFHSSAPLRALPAPLIWMLLKPLQKLMAIILGR